MNIYDVLHKDHQEVLRTLNELKNATTSKERGELVTKVRDQLIPHSRAEEATFYNLLSDMDEGKELITHSYQEHLVAEILLRALQITETVALNWTAGVEKLTEEIKHHISSEETKVWSVARKTFSEHEAQEIAHAFSKVKPKMGANIVTSQFELVANLMPKRFREGYLAKLKSSSAPKTRKAS